MTVSTSGSMETRMEKGSTSDISTILRREKGTSANGMRITIASAVLAASMLSGCATTPVRGMIRSENPAHAEQPALAHKTGKVIQVNKTAKTDTVLLKKTASNEKSTQPRYPPPPKKTFWQQTRDYFLLGIIGFVTFTSLG